MSKKPAAKPTPKDEPEFLDRWAELELDVKAEGEEAGVIKGYASVFGQTDSGRDQVMPGAFKKSLGGRSTRRIPMLLGHNQSAVPIGVWTKISEDNKGLFVEGKLALGSDAGRQMYEVLKAGAEMGISIGYRTIRKEIVIPKNLGPQASEWSDGVIRQLHEVDLREISLVPIPMLDSARITSVKNEAGEDIEPKPRVLSEEAKALIRDLERATQTLELRNLLDDATASLSA